MGAALHQELCITGQWVVPTRVADRCACPQEGNGEHVLQRSLGMRQAEICCISARSYGMRLVVLQTGSHMHQAGIWQNVHALRYVGF